MYEFAIEGALGDCLVCAVFPRFDDVPTCLYTEALCVVMVETGKAGLMDLPPRLRTREVYEAALRSQYAMLREVPSHMRDEQMCLLAVRNSALEMDYVPESLIYSQRFEALAIKENPDAWYRLSILQRARNWRLCPGDFFDDAELNEFYFLRTEGRVLKTAEEFTVVLLRVLLDNIDYENFMMSDLPDWQTDALRELTESSPRAAALEARRDTRLVCVLGESATCVLKEECPELLACSSFL